MKCDIRRLAVACGLVLVATAPLAAQREGWTRPFPAHRVIGNLYAVGTYDLGVFLVTSQEGHILINTGLEDSTSLIHENIESLGFRLEDVEILLTTQALLGSHGRARRDQGVHRGADVGDRRRRPGLGRRRI